MLVGRHQTVDLDRLPPAVVVRQVSSHGHYDFLAAWRWRRRLHDFAPQLAIAHCSRSVAFLRRALRGRAPVLAIGHSNKVRRLLSADACLVLNRTARDDFERAGSGKPCFVVPNGIPIDPGQCPVERNFARPVRLAALGRFDRVKGFDVFIEALGILRDAGRRFCAVLGGDGPELSTLSRLVAKRDLCEHLMLPGWIDDVDGFLADADIVCIPARSDAFGLTPLQAARAGVPMVLSNVSGHREIFAADAQALFADAGDPEDTARQLARLMDTPALAERLRQAAFQKVLSSYSTSIVDEKISNIIDIIGNN
jgi:glycosyltransferase involved in cell wall biosynthesis